MATDGPTVSLVHGGSHGAWCWQLVADGLRESGYRVSAVDMPVSTPGLGAEAYAEAVIAPLPKDEEVIVVGHSLAGLVIPLVAEQRRVNQLVFLAAAMPKIGSSLVDQRRDEPDSVGTPMGDYDYDAEGRISINHDDACALFYHDCDAEVAAEAAQQTVPQALTPITEVTPVTAWPPVTPSAYIACVDDRSVPIEWARRAALERLGVQPRELPGGHSPFLSRPDHLVRTLRDIFE